jgi:hypothetical protein
VNEDDCSFLFDLADTGTSLLLCLRQKYVTREKTGING